MSMLNERFDEVVKVVASTIKQYSAVNGTTDITEATVHVRSKPPAGTTYRVKMGGSKSGANNAMSVVLKLGATQVMTIEADAAAAVDWAAEFVILVKNTGNQKVSGWYQMETEPSSVDYADATVDLSSGAALVPQIVSANGSDTVYCEYCTVETWVK